MLLSERDWFRAKATIRKHKSRMDYLLRRFADQRLAASAAAEVERLQTRINELTQQLRLYDSLAQRTCDVRKPDDLMGMPDYFIARRIRLRLTQCQFAALLGVHARTLARYESTFYTSVSHRRLLMVDAVLRQEEEKAGVIQP